eukprot:CAMPEP_0184860242 /NCGR_PEP_ID=MMETSP0580-20130426/5171_1 /TAXON_ID=1118495 /ORGANISM="Dactyliosolen fragilissimus" /LENGTH=1093 /DNA_ID=CAMNT_0027357279 /DNA_START=16 /DNA_END=3297 /DNA_ORIENTATION=+
MASQLAAGAVAGARALASSAARRLSFDDTKKSPGKNVGILAIEVYTPSTFVSQERLEEHSGVAKGKYTIGLGQEGLAICGDCEDINSLALTVVHSLLEKYEIDPSEIGRLEVGTETLVDKSKSTKTVLMDLFGDNTDIEGATVINACYGGTSALLNAFSWVESDGWDGRFAIVVAADIAAYARGPARPTCGAGAVAVLVGRDAPLSFSDPREKATHASNVWDFFKPDHNFEYPQVDGALSQVCYYRALEDCYSTFADKIDKFSSKDENDSYSPFDAKNPDYFVFHAPYNKLVQKSFARLFLIDARRKYARSLDQKAGEEKKNSDAEIDENKTLESSLEEWLKKPIEETYSDRALDGVLKKLSASLYKERLEDSNAASKRIGNTYTASVFMGLASLIDRAGTRGDLNPGKTVTVFSYGSGAMATMYRLHIRHTNHTRFTLSKMAQKLNLSIRLDSREEVSPGELDLALDTRARMHHAGAPYSPVYPTVGRLLPGTYYLNGIDSKWTRTYSRVPLDATMDEHGSSLAPPIVLRLSKRDEVSMPVTGKLTVLNAAAEGNADKVSQAQSRIACVITGVSAGLPDKDRKVFEPDNLKRLISGEQCIKEISGSTKAALLEKNVVKMKRKSDGSIEKIPVDTEEKIIKLAAQLGSIDLTLSYGIPKGLAETMDTAAQVAVAAGMEALKNAGLVDGKSNDPKDWKLPEKYANRTGVVYASSFPAMDAAIGEVMRFLQSKTVGAADTMRLISALRSRMIRSSPDRELSDDDEAAFARLLSRASEIDTSNDKASLPGKDYTYDRKFLFRVLVLGNAQLAQLAGCKGPNTQTNAACAGTTQAIGMAQDMLISGRADRVVVVAGDNASGDTLLPWLGSGFCALGAATTASLVEDAALPFDKRRSGMLLGAGGIGMVLETEKSSIERLSQANPGFSVKARLLATQYSNSAFHGAALDRKHIAAELIRFLSDIELIHGISKAEIASHGVYLSHETSTHASDSSSCSGNEVAALREAFGNDLLSKLLILNTKGFTGHPMGVSFEDVAAVEVLCTQMVPPVVNYSIKDEYLGDINVSKGGAYACRYALRFAAGFGSQVAFALYATAQYE